LFWAARVTPWRKPADDLVGHERTGNTGCGTRLTRELGVSFKADTNGSITGIRFYKSAGNTGTHVGNLWSERRAH